MSRTLCILHTLRIRRISQEYGCVFKNPQSLPRQFLPCSNSQNIIRVNLLGNHSTSCYYVVNSCTCISYTPSLITSPSQFLLQGSVTLNNLRSNYLSTRHTFCCLRRQIFNKLVKNWPINLLKRYVIIDNLLKKKLPKRLLIKYTR